MVVISPLLVACAPMLPCQEGHHRRCVMSAWTSKVKGRLKQIEGKLTGDKVRVAFLAQRG